MVREIALICAMVALSLMVVGKTDKQFVHLLEGKLFHMRRNVGCARRTYRAHTSILAVILFILGFAMVGVSIIMVAKSHEFSLISVIVSLCLISLGVLGRVNSFRAATRDLDKGAGRSAK